MDQANKPNSIKPPPQHNRVLQEITGPLVFQCLKCRLIVGDSFAFVTADRDLNSVVLYAKPHNIRVGTDLLWSREGIDIGSTYILIYCNGCNLTLGKVWRTTPRKLDYIRDLYTLNLDCVMIYQLGDFIDPNSTPTDIHTLPSSRMQQISINKLKDMILILNERITTLEHTLDKRVNKTPNDSAVSSSTEGSNACIVVTPRGAQDNSIETLPNHRILG